MSRPEDDLLRAAVRDLVAEAGPPHAIAARAMALGRRQRRVRHTAVSAVTVVLVAAAVTVPYTLFRKETATSTPVPAPTLTDLGTPAWSPDAPYPLPGAARVAGVGGYAEKQGAVVNLVFDPELGRYRRLPKAILGSTSSPNGPYALAEGTGDERVQLFNLRTTLVRALPFDIGSGAVWSSDGTRLLITRATGFSVVDAATGTVVNHDVAPGTTRCLDFCLFTWLPGEGQVALPQAEAKNSEPARVTGLAVFDAGTGALLRNEAITGAPVGQDAWSPDGRSVLVRAGAGSPMQIIDVATHEPVAEIDARSAIFLVDGTVLASDWHTVTRYDSRGGRLQTLTLPPELAGRYLAFGQ